MAPRRGTTRRRFLQTSALAVAGLGLPRAVAAAALDLKLKKPIKIGCQSILSGPLGGYGERSEEHTSELQSQSNLVCRLLLEKKKNQHGVRASVAKKIGALCRRVSPGSSDQTVRVGYRCVERVAGDH